MSWQKKAGRNSIKQIHGLFFCLSWQLQSHCTCSYYVTFFSIVSGLTEGIEDLILESGHKILIHKSLHIQLNLRLATYAKKAYPRIQKLYTGDDFESQALAFTELTYAKKAYLIWPLMQAERLTK